MADAETDSKCVEFWQPYIVRLTYHELEGFTAK